MGGLSGYCLPGGSCGELGKVFYFPKIAILEFPDVNPIDSPLTFGHCLVVKRLLSLLS